MDQSKRFTSNIPRAGRGRCQQETTFLLLVGHCLPHNQIPASQGGFDERATEAHAMHATNGSFVS